MDNIYKLIGGVAITIVLVSCAPYVAEYFGVIKPLSDKAYIILASTATGLVFKALVGDVVAGEFLFHKFGYDNCIMSFGTAITSLGLQLISKNDLFIGFPSFDLYQAEPAANRSIQLFFVLLLTLVVTLLTATISSAIKKSQTNGIKLKGENLLSFFNFIIGTSLLGLYVLLLVTKS